jgi:trigger factor
MTIEKFQANHKININISGNDGSSTSCEIVVNPLIDEETKKSFNVKISASEVNKLKDSKLAALAAKVNINGFRPGKAPLNVVWKQYQENLTSEIINGFVNASVDEVRSKTQANLITSPKVDFKSFALETGLEFDVNLEMLPKFDLPDVKKISLNKSTYEIKDADVKARIKELGALRKNFVTAKDAHKAAKGDQVVIDFEGKIDGVAFAGGAAKGHTLELGTKSFIDTFEDQLVGRKKGDAVTVNVTFPADYHQKDFASKAAEFAVTIHEIKQAKDFENDEELAKAIGFASTEELETRVKETLAKECEKQVKIAMKIELFDKLDQLCKFTVPQVMIDEEFNMLWKQVQGMDANGKSEKELKEEYLKIATRRVKLGVVLTQMANSYDVKIEQQDFIDAVRAQIDAQHPSVAQSIIQYYSNNPKAVESLKGPILEEKTVDLILKDVTCVEKAVDVKKLLKADKE